MKPSSFGKWLAAAAAIAAIGTVAAQSASQAQSEPQARSRSEPMMHGTEHGAGSGARPHGVRDGERRHGWHARGHDGRGGALWQRMDENRDGQLSRAEVEQANRLATERRMQMFEQADTDRNGQVSQEEMRAFRETMREQFAHRGAERQQHRGDGESRRGGPSGSKTPAAPAVPVPGA